MAWTVGRRIGVRFPSMPPLFCFNFLLKLFCNYSTYSVEFLILFTGICSFVATAKVEFNIFRVFWSLYLRELHGRIPATIVRMDSQRYPRMLLHGHIHGNRPRGRPKKMVGQHNRKLWSTMSASSWCWQSHPWQSPLENHDLQSRKWSCQSALIRQRRQGIKWQKGWSSNSSKII